MEQSPRAFPKSLEEEALSLDPEAGVPTGPSP